MEINYYQLQIFNARAKRYSTEGEENTLGYMNFDGVPSLGNAPKQLIKDKTSLADFYLSSSDLGSRKIISSRVKELFERIRLENVRYIPCPIHQGKKVFKEFWITDVIHFDDNEVDFNLSKFELCEGWVEEEVNGIPVKFGERFTEIKFQNLGEKIEFEKNKLNHLSKIRTVTLFIKQDCLFPFIYLKEFGIYDIIISYKLKEAIQQQKMDKGIEFKPLEIPEEEWGGPNGLRKQFYS
ncbi:MAG: hypothetical protein NBV57_02370 [Algoriphagus sp.]|jgi:hypothetical protein|nr:hypothetical protein [Algoriphagus sp.]